MSKFGLAVCGSGSGLMLLALCTIYQKSVANILLHAILPTTANQRLQVSGPCALYSSRPARRERWIRQHSNSRGGVVLVQLRLLAP
jgi:hypothetical protein